MFERFVAFLDSLGTGAAAAEETTSLQLAAAALMFAVVDADGVRHESELTALRDLISDRFDVEGQALATLLDKAEAAEAESVDFYRFTSVLVRLSEGERLHLLELIWEVVYADGELHELEDNLVWRIAELMGITSRDRVELRQKVSRAAGLAPN
ncbi:MAG: TerB family tellurite resistance protein [Rhizobiaceae bacterium]